MRTLVFLCGGSLVGIVRAALGVRRDPAPEWHGWRALTRFASPAAAYAIAIWVGVRLLGGDDEAIGLLVAVIFLLMISATADCWDLLRDFGEFPPDQDG